MKLVIDLHADAGGVRVAGVAFDDWAAAEPIKTYASLTGPLERKVAGQLDLRELPGLLLLLRDHGLTPDLILFDGFVHLDAQETPGLGQHLHQALGRLAAVIGVSKSPMAQASAQCEVHREEGTAPLTVTSVGIDIGAAKARLRAMHGRKRVPTLMKLAARLARGRGD